VRDLRSWIFTTVAVHVQRNQRRSLFLLDMKKQEVVVGTRV
jgi:hypothetical protein